MNRLRFAKLKPSKLLVLMNNSLADLFTHQAFFYKMLEKSKFAKHSPHQIFQLYGSFMKTTTNGLMCITVDNCMPVWNVALQT